MTLVIEKALDNNTVYFQCDQSVCRVPRYLELGDKLPGIKV